MRTANESSRVMPAVFIFFLLATIFTDIFSSARIVPIIFGFVTGAMFILWIDEVDDENTPREPAHASLVALVLKYQQEVAGLHGKMKCGHVQANWMNDKCAACEAVGGATKYLRVSVATRLEGIAGQYAAGGHTHRARMLNALATEIRTGKEINKGIPA